MAEVADDLGIPMRPNRTTSPLLPPRTDATSTPSDGANSSPTAPSEMAAMPGANQVERRTLSVGRGISLSGQIASCDRLVIEGTVEANLEDCRDLNISPGGLFKGTASVQNAEVSGRVEGNLVVRKRLLIRAGGDVSGSIVYNEIEIDRGGTISGTVEAQTTKPLPYLSQPAFVASR